MLRATLGLLLLSGCATSTAAVVRGDFTVRSFEHDGTNVQLVTKSGSSILIDSGYEKNADLLDADLKAAGLDFSTLKAIILTHGHADHAGGARHFHEKYGTPVLVGSGDEGMVSSGKNEPLCPVGFIAGTRKDTDQSATYTGWAGFTVVSAPVHSDGLGGFDGTVTPVPGHTRGSLVVTAGDVVLVGDLLRGSIVGSGAETHLYMCDLESNKKDVARVLTEIAPQARLVFVGHFGPVTRESAAEHFGVSAP